MNFVTHSKVADVEVKEIPSIASAGAPTAATVGAVGCLYMDTDTGALYKCVAAADGIYTWVAVADETTATDATFFDIDVDGVISLKEPYRGHPKNNTYTYAVSDNRLADGGSLDGSKINELPRNIVIPEYINGIAVTGFQPGMFHYNYRVKSITLPDGVSELPDYFCRYAINLEAVNNTEGITKLGKSAISYTRIEKALFPNLVELATTALASCRFLRIVDIGNNITAIPNQCFQQSVKLERVKGGANVKTIGDNAFNMTRMLKNLSFLPNVTSIGKQAFFRSRIQFAWKGTDECSYSERATPVVDNTTDYWSSVTPTPSENPLGTMFSQSDPRWTNEQIGDAVGTDGAAVPYSKGCAFLCILHIHSALSGKTYANPDEFVEELRGLVDGANLVTLDPRNFSNCVTLLEALGYRVTYHNSETITEEIYSKMCAALANGGYVASEVSTTAYVDEGHMVVVYGMTANKEALVLDSDMFFEQWRESDLGVSDDLFLYQMPYQNLTGPQSGMIIVEKEE